VAVRYNKRADRKGASTALKRVFTEPAKSKKPIGDLDRSANVTRSKQIQKNDAERGYFDSEKEDDESGSESDSPAKERPSRPATVEHLRPPREQITAQKLQPENTMGEVSSAPERSNSTDLRSTLEKVAIILRLQCQVQTEREQCRQLREDNRALRDKYDSKVAELHEKAAEISTLERRLFMAESQAQNGTPGAFPWSSPVAHGGPPNFAGDREERQ
jgi:hypothetical protein